MNSRQSSAVSARRLTMAITELDIGGAEKAFVRIASGLRATGWDVDVVSIRNRGPLADALERADVPVEALNCRGFTDVRSVFRLHRALTSRKPQVLLTFLHQANIAGRIAGRWAGVPVIVSGVRVADRRLSVKIPERLTTCCVNHYVAVSRSVAHTHCTLCGIPESRMTVIYNGVDLAEISQIPASSAESLGVPEKSRVILFAGRLTEQKAPLDLLRAYSMLARKFLADCHLVFVGDGPQRSILEQQISRLNLQTQVRLTGWRSDLIGIMKRADLLVLPSRWEGLPNVLLEAMALGLPVIAADVDGVREVLSNANLVTAEMTHLKDLPTISVNSRYPAGDVDALRNAIQHRLSVSSDICMDQESPQVFISEQFTWPTAVAAYHQLLTELLQSRTSDRQ